VTPEGVESLRKYAMRRRASARFRAGAAGASHVPGAVPAAGVNLSLRIVWRLPANFAKQADVDGRVAEVPSMSPDALNSLFSLCIGFALAGALASGYQALVQRPAGFGLLQQGVAPQAFAAVPFLVFAAPFIIMRNTLRGARIERRRFPVRNDGDHAGGVLEPDVRHVFPDDAARRRGAGLSQTSMPMSPRTGD